MKACEEVQMRPAWLIEAGVHGEVGGGAMAARPREGKRDTRYFPTENECPLRWALQDLNL